MPWILCAHYILTLDNSRSSFIFDLRVLDAANNLYTLRSIDPHDNVALVQKILRMMADRWPSFTIQVQVDARGTITDVQ